VYEKLRNRWLGLGNPEFEPTYYELLGLSRADVSPEAVDRALADRRVRIRRHIPGPKFFRVALVIERELEKAAEVLRNPETRRAYDAEVRRQAAELADAHRARRARHRLNRARRIIARYLGGRTELSAEKRALLGRDLLALGYTREQVHRFLEKIPEPEARDGEEAAPGGLAFFRDAVRLAAERGRVDAEEIESLQAMGRQWGLPGDLVQRVIGEIFPEEARAAWVVPAAPADVEPVVRTRRALWLGAAAVLMALAAAGFLVLFSGKAGRRMAAKPPVKRRETPKPEAGSKTSGAGDRREGRAPTQPEATWEMAREAAREILACTSDAECLRRLAALREQPRFLSVLSAIQEAARSESAQAGEAERFRAREALYMAYAVKPAPATRLALQGVGLRLPSLSEEAILVRGARRALEQDAESPLPVSREDLHRLATLVSRLLETPPEDTVRALVQTAVAVRVSAELVRARAGQPTHLGRTMELLARPDTRAALVGLVSTRETAPPAAAPVERKVSSARLDKRRLIRMAADLASDEASVRRAAIRRLAADGGDGALAVFEAALRKERHLLRRIEILRGLSYCHADRALDLMLGQVTWGNPQVAHEAALRLSLMLGTFPSHRRAAGTAFVLPRANTASERAAARHLLVEEVGARKGAWRNHLALPAAGLLYYLAPTTGGGTRGSSVGDAKAGASGSRAAPPDVRALSAVITNDLNDLVRAHRAGGEGRTSPKAPPAPWAVLARGRNLDEGPAPPFSPGEPTAPGTYRGRFEVPQLPRGGEGRALEAAFRKAAAALADQVRSKKISARTALRVGRTLARAEAAAETSRSPLQRATAYLGATGEILAAEASESQEVRADFDALVSQYEGADLAAKGILEQMQVRSRFLFRVNLLACGIGVDTQPIGGRL